MKTRRGFSHAEKSGGEEDCGLLAVCDLLERFACKKGVGCFKVSEFEEGEDLLSTATFRVIYKRFAFPKEVGSYIGIGRFFSAAMLNANIKTP